MILMRLSQTLRQMVRLTISILYLHFETALPLEHGRVRLMQTYHGMNHDWFHVFRNLLYQLNSFSSFICQRVRNQPQAPNVINSVTRINRVTEHDTGTPSTAYDLENFSD